MSLGQSWTSYWVEVRIKSGKTCRRQTWPQWNVDSQMKSLWICETPGICYISSLFVFAFSFNCLVSKGKKKACLLSMTLKWCLPSSIEARDQFLLDNLGFSPKPQCVGLSGSLIWLVPFQIHWRVEFLSGSWETLGTLNSLMIMPSLVGWNWNPCSNRRHFLHWAGLSNFLDSVSFSKSHLQSLLISETLIFLSSPNLDGQNLLFFSHFWIK